ncbi:MAG: hypothetical protein POH28_11690, partial [Acidocella sp.]|nr:hypothetical protein [Acidocella sp.]
VFIWLVTDANGRIMLRGPFPWLAMGVAALVFAPDVAWNAAHHWVSYAKQGSRVTNFDVARALPYFAGFCFGQIGLVTPIIFALAALGLWRLRDQPAPGGHLLVWLTIVPGVVFLEHVISGPVQPNWAAIMYPSACLAAASLPMAVLRRWLTPALALGFGLNALVSAQALSFILPLPPRIDPLALQLSGWRGLAREASAGARGFVTSDDYATSAILAFYAPPDVSVVGFGPRWLYLGPPDAALTGVAGDLVTRRTDTPCPVVLGRVTRRQGHKPMAVYRVCAYTANVPGVVLPRP